MGNENTEREKTPEGILPSFSLSHLLHLQRKILKAFGTQKFEPLPEARKGKPDVVKTTRSNPQQIKAFRGKKKERRRRKEIPIGHM
jgi:hypothetical protein